MGSEANALGQRIRSARKMRHLTVRQLAEAMKVSVSLLEKFEQGTRTPSSRHIAAMAIVLRVSIDRLHGHPSIGGANRLNGIEVAGGIQAVFPDLRTIMLTHTTPDDLPAAVRPLPVLAIEVEEISRMRQNGRYLAMAPLLPALLTELTHLALEATEGERRERAFWWLARAYRAANSLAHKLGFHDLSVIAIERVRWASARSGDPLMEVVGGYLLLGAMLRQGAWKPAVKLMAQLERQLGGIAGGWDETTRGLLGSIVLKRAAGRARQGDLSGAFVDFEEAAELAGASEKVDGIYYETAFGPANILIHEVHSLIHFGEAEAAVRRAAGFDPPAGLPGERRSHHLIDLAAAQLAIGDREGSLRSLRTARVIAPNHTRFHPTARQTAAALARQDRGNHEAVTGFARWVGAI